MRRPRTLLSTTLAAGVLIVGLAACGGGSVSDELAERAIEQASGGDADVDIDTDGSFSIETEDGSYTADADGNVEIVTDEGTSSVQATDELPDGFPDVPLPAGLDIQSVTTVDTESSKGFSLVGTIPDGDEAAFDALLAEYEAGGWSIDLRSVSDDGAGGLYASAVLSADDLDGVAISFLSDGSGGTTVSITTSPNI